MATDLERMVVSLEASITKYEKAMNKAVGEARSTSNKIEKEFAGLDSKLSNMFGAIGRGFGPGLISGLAGGAAAFLSIEGVINGATAAFEKFGQVADLSGAAGLNAEFFQAIAFQASQAGVEIETLGGALVTFAKNSALAVEGRGKLFSQLEVLSPALLESIRLAETQEERFRLVIDALGGIANEAERVAVASAAFGESGAKIANAFQGGRNELEKMIDAAREAGVVVDDDLIAKADELGDEWAKNSAIIDTQLKVALMELGPVLVWLTGLAANLLGGIGAVITAAQNAGAAIEAASRRGMAAQGTAAGAAVGGLLGTGLPEVSDLTPSWLGSPNLAAGVDTGLTGAIAGATPQIEQLNGASEELFQTVGGELAPALSSITTDFDNLGAAAGHGGGGKGRGGGGGKGAADSVAELIEELQNEQAMLGQSSTDQEVNNALRKAGAGATAEQKAQIEELVRAIEAQKAAQKAADEAMKEFTSLASSALKGFINDLREGKTAAEALGNALNNIGDKLLDKGLDMLLNAALSAAGMPGGFAEGGIAQHGLRKFASGGVSSSAAIFGERGPEAAVPLPNGRQIPVDLRLGKTSPAMAPAMQITVGVSADSVGNLTPFVESVTTRGITRAAPLIVATANKTVPAAIAQHQRDIAGSDYRLA